MINELAKQNLKLSFRIGGNSLRLTTNSRLVFRKVKEWLNFFICPEGEEGIELRLFSGDENPRLLIPEEAEHIYSGYSSEYTSEHFLHNGLWLIDFHGLGWMAVDRERETASGFVHRRYLKEKPWLLLVIVYPIFEILNKKGLYPAHSGAVSLGDNGLLIAGAGKSGKTTLVLHLVAKGFKFLSDDRCFLRRTASGFEVLAFPEEVKVYLPNVADLPEFQFLQGNAHNTAERRTFNNQDIYPDCVVGQAGLKVVVFPRWRPREPSHIEVVRSSDALIEMLPLIVGSLFPDTTRAQFEFVGNLVERLPCFKLYLGSDKERWQQLLLELIQ